MPILGTLIGLHYVLSGRGKGLEDIPSIGRDRWSFFIACLRILRMIYASTMNIRYLFQLLPTLLPKFLEAV